MRLTIDKTEINGEKITLQSEIGYERFGEIKPINIEENKMKVLMVMKMIQNLNKTKTRI